MELNSNVTAVVAGGASGLGHATAVALAATGCKVAIFDLSRKFGEAAARETGGSFHLVDVTDPASIDAGLAEVERAHGTARVVVNCAGIAPAMKTVSRDRLTGTPSHHDLDVFARVVAVNLTGTFNLAAMAAAHMARLDALAPDQERGVIVLTSSIAAEDGQIGQAAYAASKAGVAGMVLPMARDLAREGIRVVTIMPGLFATPMLAGLPADVQAALGQTIPFPGRLGAPAEFAGLVKSIIGNVMLNGCAIRLDGGLRMPPR